MVARSVETLRVSLRGIGCILMACIALWPNGVVAQSPGEAEGENLQVVEWVDPCWVPTPSDSQTEQVVAGDGTQAGEVPGDSGAAADKASAAEKVIGKDDRVVVGNTTLFPWRAIGRVEFTRKPDKGTFQGSGALIGPKTVLTCGHALIGAKRWSTDVTFAPGQNGSSTPYGVIKVVKMQTLTKYWSDEDRNYDIGMMTLEKPIGNTTGYLLINSKPPSYYSNALLNTAGYPWDRGYTNQCYTYGNSFGTTGNLVTYYIDNVGGQSGSPMWIYTKSNNERRIIAVNVAENDTTNFATQITIDFFKVINDYLKQNDTIYYTSNPSYRSILKGSGNAAEVNLSDVLGGDAEAPQGAGAQPFACGNTGGVLPGTIGVLMLWAVRSSRLRRW
jgi:glutamyl endopeptidase